jgi:hypothetical protein
MKTKTAILSMLIVIGAAVQLHAQNLVQNLTVSLTAYNPDNGRAFVITTRDVIRNFIGTNVLGGQLQLVTPVGNAPGTTGNLNAFLRISQRNVVLMEINTPNQFNLFQDASALTTFGTAVISRAINRFSIDFGSLHAELQGFSTWTITTRLVGGNDVSGSGSFTSTVSQTA